MKTKTGKEFQTLSLLLADRFAAHPAFGDQLGVFSAIHL
jgi:hypothetical protein